MKLRKEDDGNQEKKLKNNYMKLKKMFTNFGVMTNSQLGGRTVCFFLQIKMITFFKNNFIVDASYG